MLIAKVMVEPGRKTLFDSGTIGTIVFVIFYVYVRGLLGWISLENREEKRNKAMQVNAVRRVSGEEGTGWLGIEGWGVFIIATFRICSLYILFLLSIFSKSSCKSSRVTKLCTDDS